MVAAGLGSAVCIDGLVPSAYADSVVFKPFSPTISSDAYLAWRKGVPLSPAAAALVERVRGQVAPERDSLKLETASRQER